MDEKSLNQQEQQVKCIAQRAVHALPKCIAGFDQISPRKQLLNYKTSAFSALVPASAKFVLASKARAA
jgi:hypothetical protein